ncbi:hypothetical protein FB567DRAFT_553925 [Paraphoma chrysanthemicola]|uniref:Uncharacterized protein n=1 Tax=Paraphoma chrysanthemicola TaxID=798071 RepID=A0A8K0QVR1_9PLEO|nr:hypothetical protein FB567DRAFT_553925 [Paraphoma chrysanthemicola]
MTESTTIHVRITAVVDPFQISQTGQENIVTIPSPTTTNTAVPESILIGSDCGTTFSMRNCFSEEPAKSPRKMLCGAIFIDQDFEAMIAQLPGDPRGVPDSVKTEMINSQWERDIQKAFEDHPCHCVKAHDKDMFENIVSRVRRLVDSQIAAVESKENKLPKGMDLVGGFGSCRSIHKVLDHSVREPWCDIMLCGAYFRSSAMRLTLV